MLHRRPLPSLPILALLLTLGCGDTDLPVELAPATTSFAELKREVSRLRALPFRADVTMRTQTPEEIGARVEKSVSAKHGPLAQVGRVYAHLGLLPEGTDLHKSLTELRRVLDPIAYDPAGRNVLVPEGPPKPGLFSLIPLGRAVSDGNDLARQFLLTRALIHALQDQHFRWDEAMKSTNTQDRDSALRALSEGDAVLVELARLAGDKQKDPKKLRDGIKMLGRLEERLKVELPHIPEFFRQKAAFEFFHGSQFVLWAYSRKGWEGVDTLFSRPPISSQQILHPEKYYVQREEPIRILPWGLIRLARTRGETIMEDTLGEFVIQALLGVNLPKEEASKAAAGWAGDILVAFQQKDQLVLGWFTAWDDAAEAAEFHQSYRRVLEARHGTRLQPASNGNDTLISGPQTGATLLLQRRDNFVLYLDGIPPPESLGVAAGLWEELETEQEPPPVRFDLVGLPRQSLRPSR